MSFTKSPVKGMCDMLPADMRLRERLLTMIKRSYGAHGFLQIETPAMEHIGNLTSRQGGDNEKLIFKVLKRGAELARALESGSGELADNGLRYDLTVPLARYYANNRELLPSPFKALQIGSVWRAENPQKGRFRQFTQCDIDILGDASNLAEIELVAATSGMLASIFAGIPAIHGFTVHINDRRILRAVALQAGFREEDIGPVLVSLDKLDKIGLDGVRDEMLRGGLAPEAVERYLAVYRDAATGASCAPFCAPVPAELLPADVAANLDDILASVRPMLPEGVSLVFDPALVRGMGYYTGPIFEVTLDGYGFAVAGGGRYDKMIGKFSGQDVPAAGFSIGFERIVTILKDHASGPEKIAGETVAFLIAPDVPQARRMEVLREARDLRATGATVVIQPMQKNIRRQIELLEAEGYARFEKIRA